MQQLVKCPQCGERSLLCGEMDDLFFEVAHKMNLKDWDYGDDRIRKWCKEHKDENSSIHIFCGNRECVQKGLKNGDEHFTDVNGKTNVKVIIPFSVLSEWMEAEQKGEIVKQGLAYGLSEVNK